MYLIPVFALDPSSHCIAESELGSEDFVIDLSKCSECSAKGRKFLSVRDRQNLDINTLNDELDSTCEANTELVPETKEMLSSDSGNGVSHSGILSNNGSTVVEPESEKNAGNEEPVQQSSGFSYGEKEKERLNRILKRYVGTHNFHNFTTRTKADDPSAKRYIISFTANTTLTVKGIEFVKCEVVGQSFMLHQIRKMIGLAVAIMRDCAPESIIETAFRK